MARKKKRYTRQNLPPCPDPGQMHLAQDKVSRGLAVHPMHYGMKVFLTSQEVEGVVDVVA